MRDPYVERVEALIQKAKDPKRPTKLFRLTAAQHQRFIDSLLPGERAKLQADIEVPNSTQVLNAPAAGQWLGMRFVIVDGASDLPLEAM